VTRRAGWVVVVAAIALLTAVWRVLPAGSPPLYDGNCIADPYVMLAGQPPAKGATMSFPATKTPFPASEVFTSETPPQAQLLMESGSFDNTIALRISIAPVVAPAVKPPNGAIEGNVYKFSAVNTAGVAVAPRPNVLLTIVLRATASLPAPIIDRFNGTAWTSLSTQNSGCGNTFLTTSMQLGEFAAVGPAGATPRPSGSGGGLPIAAIVGGLAILLLVAVVALFSLERGRRRAG
jgi:hypothetical protein